MSLGTARADEALDTICHTACLKNFTSHECPPCFFSRDLAKELHASMNQDGYKCTSIQVGQSSHAFCMGADYVFVPSGSSHS